ncbi:hypothetical protein JK359_05590 [Streptomyces actinomycinicus]|uniref:Uncharacterized protein n=1 Tax=Streptomyces actinomycinicus TaxID=1695166 RepID=A0A937EG10_9ACTN|nr:hypothetical protein [Streptomyces actinomycinicus]MBL1081455.1 hypothetical protein [Streptomyces actinomycinicus]
MATPMPPPAATDPSPDELTAVPPGAWAAGAAAVGALSSADRLPHQRMAS